MQESIDIFIGCFLCQDHENKCCYLEVGCWNRDCKKAIARNEMKKHLKECEFRPTPCQFCQKIVPFAKLEVSSYNVFFRISLIPIR